MSNGKSEEGWECVRQFPMLDRLSLLSMLNCMRVAFLLRWAKQLELMCVAYIGWYVGAGISIPTQPPYYNYV
jgi:hypothetical protein